MAQYGHTISIYRRSGERGEGRWRREGGKREEEKKIQEKVSVRKPR